MRRSGVKRGRAQWNGIERNRVTRGRVERARVEWRHVGTRVSPRGPSRFDFEGVNAGRTTPPRLVVFPGG